MDLILFMLSPTTGHVVCFRLLSTVSNATGVCTWATYFSVLSGISLGAVTSPSEYLLCCR